MARIKVNGRYHDVDDLVLEIPGICSVDFMNGTVTSYSDNSRGRIEGRLLVLLNYLYHRNGFTSLDTIINDLYDGFAAEGTVKADINNLRKRIHDYKDSDGNYQIIQNARGRGYILMVDEPTVIGPIKPRHPEALLIRMRTGDAFSIRKQSLRIGDSSCREDRVDIALSDKHFINRVHAEIFCDGKSFFIRELKASGAAQADGHILAQGEALQLGECAELILGSELFFFLSGSAGKFVLGEGRACAVCSRDSGETRLLLDAPLLLDRYHPWRQNVLKDSKISRSAQAKAFRENGQSFLLDLGSKNGTFCNDLCLVPGEAVPIHSGDSISIVDTVFSYYEVELALREGAS